MMMILPLRYTHIGRCFRVVAEYTLNPPTRGLNTSDHLCITPTFGYGAPYPSASGTPTHLIWALPSTHYALC